MDNQSKNNHTLKVKQVELLSGAMNLEEFMSQQSQKLVWLHLSDIHFEPSVKWRDAPARAQLLDFLKGQFESSKLPKPDLIFCTGDIAFGEDRAGALREQYAQAKNFFSELRNCCHVAADRIFVVPGNHDINRKAINEDAQAGLISKAKEADKHADAINKRFSTRSLPHSDALKRLNEYAELVADTFAHQQSDDHIHACVLEIKGKKVGIGGFNSAWSCAGDTDDRNLWMAAEWQFKKVLESVRQSDIRIGLIHHPQDWFNRVDRTLCDRRIDDNFQFWLHGHTHDAWVSPGEKTVKIRAGAINADHSDEFGFNLSSLDFSTGKGEIHLFHYTKLNDVWAKDTRAKSAPEGIWPIQIPASQYTQLADAPPVVDLQDILRPAPSTYPFLFLRPLDVTRTLPAGQFVGRIAQKEKLIKGLAGAGKRMGIFGLYGMGGIGKSQLAIEVVADLEQTGTFTDGILWLRIGRDQFEETLMDVWLRLGGDVLTTPDYKKIVHTLKLALQDKCMLVVLDNADQPDRVPPLLDLFARQSILITGRQRETPDVDWLELDLLSASESRDLLCQLAPALSSNTDAELDTLTIDRLGRLPLAISLAGHWLAGRKHSLTEYVQRFDRYRLDALSSKGGTGVDARKHDLRACFHVSWEPLSAMEQQAFVLASMFSVKDFPENLLAALIATARKRMPADQDTLADAADTDADATPEALRAKVIETADAMDQLVSANLLFRPTPGRLAMHALLRDYGRERAGDISTLHEFDQRALAEILQQTLKDDADKFALAERELISSTLEQLVPWPDDCWRLLTAVDGIWMEKGLNLLRERLLIFLLDRQTWPQGAQTYDRAALNLADAMLRLGKQGDAEKWLETVNDSAERRDDDGSVVRARYLLRHGNPLREQNRWPDTMRRAWRHGDLGSSNDAIHAFIGFFNRELSADLGVILQSRIEMCALDTSNYGLAQVNMAQALMDADKPSASAKALDVVLDMALRKDLPELLAFVSSVNGCQALRAGDVQRANTAFADALQQARQIGAMGDECWAQLGMVATSLVEAYRVTPDTLASAQAVLLNVRELAERHQDTDLAIAAKLRLVEILLLKGCEARQVLRELNPLRRELIAIGNPADLVEAELLATRLDLQVGLPANRTAALQRFGRVRATVAQWWATPWDVQRLCRTVERLFDETEEANSAWQAEIAALAAQPYDLRPAWLACAGALPERLVGHDGMALCLVRSGIYPIPTVLQDKCKNIAQFVYPFYLDEHPVTVAQYARFCEETGHPMPLGDGFGANNLQEAPDSPVVRVSLGDAQAYARWAGRCLPVREEWLAAYCGQRDGRFPWGDDPKAVRFLNTSTRSGEDFVRVHPLTSFDEARFLVLLMDSLSLSVAEKRRVLEAIPVLSQFQIDELFKVFEDEILEFERLQPTEGEFIAGLQNKARAESMVLLAPMPKVCSVDGDAAECGARDLCGVVREWYAQPVLSEQAPQALGSAFGHVDADQPLALMGTVVGRDLQHHAASEDNPQFADTNVGFRLALPLTGEVPLPASVQAIFDAWSFKT